MSLRMKLEKKKAQEEMRKLMAERRKKDVKTTNINNPLAKYNNAGQLMCLLCSSIVRSEHVWTVHTNSKQHRENIEKAKKLKELTNNFTVSKLKRSSPPKDVPPKKKLKSILKNSSSTKEPEIKPPSIVLHHDEEIKRSKLSLSSESMDTADATANSLKESDTKSAPVPEQPIPEGFFDDPILDAKVRNIEYKDPIEEEWEKFQKEIKEEASASAEIIAGEQEEATAERQLDEIEEQMRNWSRVLDLELKKEETKKKNNAREQMSEDENDSDNDEDIDEFLDWRAKKSYT